MQLKVRIKNGCFSYNAVLSEKSGQAAAVKSFSFSLFTCNYKKFELTHFPNHFIGVYVSPVISLLYGMSLEQM